MKAIRLWGVSALLAASLLLNGIAVADANLLAAEEGETAAQVTAPAALPAAESPLEKGTRLFKQAEYDEAVRVLEKAASSDPYHFETNILLAKALLGKCEMLKHQGNDTYKILVHRPYQIGQRLYRTNPTRPEPYYLVAKSLVINNRPRKAGRTIKKAIYYAGPAHEDYAEYQVVLGDSWMGIMGDDPRGYARAKKAYQMALSEKSGDPKFVKKIETRLEKLEHKHTRLP